jgi:hypothetical protein
LAVTVNVVTLPEAIETGEAEIATCGVADAPFTCRSAHPLKTRGARNPQTTDKKIRRNEPERPDVSKGFSFPSDLQAGLCARSAGNKKKQVPKADKRYERNQSSIKNAARAAAQAVASRILFSYFVSGSLRDIDAFG